LTPELASPNINTYIFGFEVECCIYGVAATPDFRTRSMGL
jgi:hypothetical protein